MRIFSGCEKYCCEKSQYFLFFPMLSKLHSKLTFTVSEQVICNFLFAHPCLHHRSLCAPVCVCGVQGIQHCAYILFLRFYVYLFVDLIKRGIHALVGEILHYENDRYYYYYLLKVRVTLQLQM